MSSYKERIKLFSGNTHLPLAREVSKILNLPIAKIDLSRFASNETYVRLGESVRGKEVFVVQTCTQSVNDDYMELFLMCNAFKMSFAKKVHVILPYYGYSRQDRIAEPRESLSAKLIADLLVHAGADHVVTFTLHTSQIQGFFDIPVDNINTMGLFVSYFKNKKLINPVIVSPDVGGAKAAKKFADALDYPLAILNKIRPGHNVSEVTHIVGDIKGKTAIIYDDMIDTAGSVWETKKALTKEGARKDIYLCATHAVFSGPAVERLKKARFKEVIVTNTLPLNAKQQFPGLKIISIAHLVAGIIKNVYEERSVTSLYGQMIA